MAIGYWQASPRRRRFILRRYGRGPKKKPPDKLCAPFTAKPYHFSKVKSSSTSKRRRSPPGIVYRNCNPSIINNQVYDRTTAPFLAGSRRSFKNISKSYWLQNKHNIIKSPYSNYIVRSVKKHFNTSCKHFSSVQTSTLQAFNDVKTLVNLLWSFTIDTLTSTILPIISLILTIKNWLIPPTKPSPSSTASQQSEK